MSTTFYIVRHGQSVANDLGIFLGQVDMDLTETGRKQAQITADHFKNQGIKPDAIYASDLSRAYNTARATAALWEMPIHTDVRLREINAGAWEGVPFEELPKRFPRSYTTWLQDIGNAKCDGGETAEDVQNRFIAALTDIAHANKDRTVFIFTHATPIRVFAAHCMGKTLDDVKNIPWASNASVTKAVFQNDIFQLIEYGINDFMGKFITKLPANV